METVRLHIVGMSLFMETKILLILQTLGNNLAPMKICPGGGAWWAPLAPGLIMVEEFFLMDGTFE